jgi:tetratricopeptide (TPR) repeat protein
VRDGERPAQETEYEERRRAVAPERDQWVLQRTDTARKPKSDGAPRSTDGEWRLPEDAVGELKDRVSPKRAVTLAKFLKDAARAYAGERWGDVRKALRPLLAEVPDAPAVQELHGMLLYRTGKWAAAVKELQASHQATNSYDLHPAMMDANRALKRPKEVERLWDELRIASPSGEVMAEGRIVMAESLAEQDRLSDAIRLLEKAPRPKQRLLPHHLRSMYVLGDLYDRAGNSGKARTLFSSVASQDPDLADVVDRLEALD